MAARHDPGWAWSPVPVVELSEGILVETLVAELEACRDSITDLVRRSRAAMEIASRSWFGDAEREAAVALAHLDARLASISTDLALAARFLRSEGVSSQGSGRAGGPASPPSSAYPRVDETPAGGGGGW